VAVAWLPVAKGVEEVTLYQILQYIQVLAPTWTNIL
jgi:hypothetical protein